MARRLLEIRALEVRPSAKSLGSSDRLRRAPARLIRGSPAGRPGRGLDRLLPSRAPDDPKPRAASPHHRRAAPGELRPVAYRDRGQRALQRDCLDPYRPGPGHRGLLR